MKFLITAHRVHLSRIAFFPSTFRSKKLLLRDGIHHFEKEGHARVQGHLQQEGLREVQQRPLQYIKISSSQNFMTTHSRGYDNRRMVSYVLTIVMIVDIVMMIDGYIM